MISYSPPPTYRDRLHELQRQYDDGIKTGQFPAYVYPWVFLPFLLVIIYLLIPHSRSPFLKSLRWPVWFVMMASCVYCAGYCKARNMATGFAVGLMESWGAMWCTTVMMIHDCQVDFKRIERTEGGAARFWRAGRRYQVTYEPVAATHSISRGEIKETNSYAVATSKISKAEDLGTTRGPRTRKGKIEWQPYPITPLIERVDWVADLFCNFRGMGWNWQVTGPAPVPLLVQKELHDTCGTPVAEHDTKYGRNGTRRCDTAKEILHHKLSVFLTGYVAFDLLKMFMIHDPYFWGVIDAAPPPHLPHCMQSSPFLLKGYRLILSQLGILTALCTICALGAVFFVNICGPNLLGVRGEPWLYPATYGSYSNVFDHGLGGWWGGWWHQAFRFAFDAPSKKLNAALGIEKSSVPGRFVQLVVAFALSGVLHATGSHTQMGKTSPLSGPFLFFSLQPLGIMAQLLAAQSLQSAGVTENIPKFVRRLTNFVYVHMWFYYTAPLLCDDFAKGGLWLVEPVPISPLRALGFGVEGDSWWCWGSSWRDWMHWHSGKHWWQSGIAL